MLDLFIKHFLEDHVTFEHESITKKPHETCFTSHRIESIILILEIIIQMVHYPVDMSTVTYSISHRTSQHIFSTSCASRRLIVRPNKLQLSFNKPKPQDVHSVLLLVGGKIVHKCNEFHANKLNQSMSYPVSKHCSVYPIFFFVVFSFLFGHIFRSVR